MPPYSSSSSSTHHCKKLLTSTHFTTFVLLFTSLPLLYLLLSHTRIPPLSNSNPNPPPPKPEPTTSLLHLVFSIASSSTSFPKRQPYIRTWFQPSLTRAYLFLDRHPSYNISTTTPPYLISTDTSRFPYTFKGGLRSAIRVARIVKEIADLSLPNVRWFVFGDDDTVFFTDNLVKTLAKYDHNKWFYVGSNSESFDQNVKFSFDMAFGGGGFAISAPLARVLARVLDSCLVRYAHLYGSDARVFSCLAELGVVLTHEPGFHQVDMRGDIFGMLSSHPLTPLLSLHHVDSVQPIFPNMNRSQAIEKLFVAVKTDPERILQQTVCYDRSNSQTISISWGYSVQVYEGNILLPDLLPLQRTFTPWKRGANVNLASFMLNVRNFPKDPCQRPAIFFMETVFSDRNGTQSIYKKHAVQNCLRRDLSKSLEQVRVFSPKLELDVGEPPRRHCCDVLSTSSDKRVNVAIRQCGNEELISMSL